MNELKGQALLSEMDRRSNDECLVLNPTEEDFVYRYGNMAVEKRTFLIPNKNKDIGYGKGQRVVPRYIATRYIKHMTNQLINQEWEAKMLPEKAKFDKRGEWFGQKELTTAPKTNDEKLRQQFFPLLWGGVVREFGKDEIPEEQRESGGIDRRSFEQRMMDESTISPDDFISQIEEKDATTAK